MADKSPEKIESPCIGRCCLDDNDICIGCYRSLTEITGWASKCNVEKIEILELCEERKQARNKH